MDATVSTKQCGQCGITKPREGFHIDRGKRDGCYSSCKSCRQQKSASTTARMESYWRGIRYRYGVTDEDWNLLFEAQGRACGICGLSEDEVLKPRGRTPWHVDHCHATGLIRGILCSHCNQGIGHFRDDPGLLMAARDYLEKA